MGRWGCCQQGLSKVRNVQLLQRSNSASQASPGIFYTCYSIMSCLQIDSRLSSRDGSSTMVHHRQVQKLHSYSSQNNSAPSEADVEAAISDMTATLGNTTMSVPEIWAKYDQLKIRRMLSFLPYEAWISLLKTCQRDPPHTAEPLRRHLRERLASDSYTNTQTVTQDPAGSGPDDLGGKLRYHPSFPLRQSHTTGLQSSFAKDFVGSEQFVWTQHTSKRRALMFLGDMWRYSGIVQPVDSHGRLIIDNTLGLDQMELMRRSDNTSSWQPSEHHYNVVLDVINRDPSSKIDEMLLLHRDMKSRGIREDTITFNTILNGCRRLRNWVGFADIQAQILERDRCGITSMDAYSWGTLIQGYREQSDWKSVDRCITSASSACHEWFKAQRDEDSEDCGIKPTVQLWCTIISAYADRNMIPQMLAARRVMSGLGVRPSVYAFGPIFAAFHKERQIMVRKGKDATHVMKQALREYKVMRDEGVEPNEVILTNLMLTIGYSRQDMDSKSTYSSDKDADRSDHQKKLVDVFRLISQKLESILVQSHNPQIYAALIGIAGRARRLDEVRYFWRTLISEARLPHAEHGRERPHLLNSLTLGSYLGALINCRQYNDAVSSFLEFAFSKKTEPSHKEHARSLTFSLKLQSVNRDVYETSLKAFALANQHSMCPVVISRMIGSGIQPTVLSLRHSLLSPDWKNSPNAAEPLGYARKWTLPLSLAQEIWNLVLPTRQQVWARREFHGDHVGGDDVLEGELPVVTNDVSSQLIRIAARAPNVQFGEQVFAAFESEISCFGTRRSRDPAEGVDDTQPDNRRRFPSHMQCDPNVHTYTSMVTLYANNTDIHGVGKMWNLMLRDGVEPNLHTYTSLVVALHRYALRERWRRLREHKRSSVAEDGHKAAGSDSRGKDTQPWASTKHDAMIDNIEEWLVNKNDDAKENIRKHSSDYSVADEASSSSGEASPSLDWFKEIASLDIDIPLSTLLLRYRAVRIREAMGKTHFNGHAKRRDYEQDEAIKQIQRAMELCQKVESAGLQPDFKFQTALADLFDACGDKPGAELVRRRIEEVYKRRSSR